MNNFVLQPLLLILPLVIGGIIHMIVVKADAFSILRRPINLSAFGRNKTWRGIVVVPAATILGCFIASLLEATMPEGAQLDFKSLWLPLGFLLGLAYVLFELPNSWLKRRLGIPEGALPAHHKWLFFALDHLDSATGCCLVYLFYLRIPPAVVGATILWGFTIHSAVNYALFLLKIRRSPT